ncbi:hypothetical protein AN396_08050 [Candidatus Epulonipiscium fishelsonii]|uniref:Uncharacterized protein n=1 Tax=Candidatus Epulonipiscium fishelsonii TaxID=77094 RepID=A0ACC8XAI4_9FIRM|nr:hypothetical protein AN396_08050 [Epulopiscium sp. SCG-B11WGA-EpuloA1]
MKLQKITIFKLLILLLTPISILLLYLYEYNPQTWEELYSLGINKYFIEGISSVFGTVSFSVFEVLIGFTLIFLVGFIIGTFFYVFKYKGHALNILANSLLNFAVVASILFTMFITFWGLNYKRPEFGQKEDLVVKKYTHGDLGAYYTHLLTQAGRIRNHLNEDENGIVKMDSDYEGIFTRAPLGFYVLGEEFETLSGIYGPAKPIMGSKALNYTGITGIYSPFTGEPNVNVAIPEMFIPSTTCHEMAHQHGYGFEDQCNFIAYITCMAHPHLDFKYSGYLLAIAYTSNALAKVDFDLLVSINKHYMPKKVLDDLNYGNDFWSNYQGDVQKVSQNINNSYLKANGVTAGTESYGEVVDLLLSYYEKYHKKYRL